MSAVVSLLSLAGVWLVFAGAVYQATLELRAEVAARELFVAGRKLLVVQRPEVSRWWWLVPPVRMVLMRAHVERAQAALFESLSATEYATLVGY